MGKASGPIGSNSPNRVAALAVLDQAPSGKYARDLAAVLDMTPGRCSKMLQNLRTAGVIGSMHEGGDGSARRVRYFALQHEAAAKAAHDAAKGVTWGRGLAPSRKHLPRLHTAADPKVMPKPVICPAFKGDRFAVDKPEEFFSKPGYSPDFIGHDTWAARAYPCA